MVVKFEPQVQGDRLFESLTAPCKCSLRFTLFDVVYFRLITDIWRCIRQIGDLVFNRFLELISKRGCSRKRDEELEAHTQFLLVKFNHENGSIRRVADRYLSEMVDRFPYLLWNDVVIKTMLDLLKTLDDETRKMVSFFLTEYLVLFLLLTIQTLPASINF